MEHAAIEAALTARDKIFSISAVTAMPALQLQYIGGLAFGNYAVVGTTLTLFADDTDGATTAVLVADTNAAGYDTWGELDDAINATGVFRSFLIGPGRDEDSDAMLDAIANATCKLKHGVTLFFEQDTTDQIYGFGVTNQKFVYRPTGGWATFESGWTKDTNCINSLKYITNTLGNGAATMNIYSNDDYNKQAGVLLFSSATVDDTATAVGDTVPNEIHVRAVRGHRMSIQYVNGTGTNDWDAAVIRAIVHTEDVAGGQVPGANYTGIV